MDPTILAEAHDFWFGELSGPDDFPADRAPSWFRQSDDFDAAIRERFASHLQKVAATDWDLDVLRREEQVGLVVFLDQFPRNLFRVTGEAFAYDARAREIAGALVERGLERFYLAERPFVLMPYMHSEKIRDQDRSVALFAELALAAEGDFVERLRNNLDFATKHRDIIRKFGRFPHRNEMLGRESTDEERAQLESAGRGF